MIICYKIYWDNIIHDILYNLDKNMKEMDVFGLLKFNGAIFVLENNIDDPDKIVCIEMNSPFDLVPRFFKRIAFRIALFNKKYKYKVKYTKEYESLSIVLNQKLKLRKLFENGTQGSLSMAREQEE